MARAPGARPRGRVPWGWLEIVIVAQPLLGALVFVPGLGQVRVLIRVAVYMIALLAWAHLGLRGRRGRGQPFPAVPWLAVCVPWLLLSIFHPTTSTLMAGIMGAGVDIAVLSPVFWAPAALRSARQVRRVLLLLFLCNAAGAVMGIAQFYRPATFNPPVIPALARGAVFEDIYSYIDATGRRVLRPCGLTDTPGGASVAGAMSALLGICWALRPMAAWKRLACLALGMAGAAIIYLCMVRLMLLSMLACIPVLAALFLLRGDAGRSVLVVGGAVVALACATLWAARNGGEMIIARFRTLLAGNPTKLYHDNRGHFVQYTLEEVIWEYPLGAGLGRWGVVNGYFGDPTPTAERQTLWAEVQVTAWVYDGGIPMLVCYTGAIVVAMLQAFRIARTCPNEEIAFWAAVVVALALNVVIRSMGSVAFSSADGVQFWILLAMIHAADQQIRAERAAQGAARARSGATR
ncbi:MAG: hypothetical protein IRY99_18290 [Isosphaeraceae bacterium]|nr:hypothetical protein [Isosphaeraceae bacterium]